MDKSVHIRGHTRSCCFLSWSECSLQFVKIPTSIPLARPNKILLFVFIELATVQTHWLMFYIIGGDEKDGEERKNSVPED